MALFPNGRWLLCAPAYFDVIYEINPWMSVKRAPKHALAYAQWQELHHTLIRLGAWIEYVDPQPGLPDMVFTANGGLIKGKKCVLPRFRHKERQGEEAFFRSWFKDSGYTVHQPKSGYFEGEGDALFVGDTLFGGYGFRTDKIVFKEVQKYLNIKKVVPVKLVDGRFYHLDTCFCPIDSKRAIFFPKAFTREGVKELGKNIDLIPIPESDAKKFACNSVVLGKTIVMPAGCESTAKILRSLRFNVNEVPLTEFMKAGGSAKCLSLKL